MWSVEVISNIVAGVICALAALGVLTRKKKKNFHVTFATAILLFSTATIIRGVNWNYNTVWGFQIGYIGFIFSPFVFLIFVEQLTRQATPLFLKLFALFGSLILVVFDFSLFNTKVWLYSILPYHFILSTYCAAALQRWAKSGKTLRDRNMGWFTFGVYALSLVLFYSDMFSQVVAGLFRAGSLPLLILTFGFVTVFDSEGAFQVKELFRSLLNEALLIAALFIVLPLVVPIPDQKTLFLSTTLIYATQKVVTFLFKAVSPLSTQTQLLTRLNRLNKTSSASFLASVQSMDEVEKVRMISREELDELNAQDLLTFEGLVDRSEYSAQLDETERLRMNLKLTVLKKVTGCSYFYVIDFDSGILAVQLTPVISEKFGNELVGTIGSYLRNSKTRFPQLSLHRSLKGEA